MNGLRQILKNINVINIILLGIILLFVLYLLRPYFHPDVAYRLTVVSKPQDDSSVPEQTQEQEKSPFPTDYQIIAEQNPFSEERKIIDQTTEPVATADFVLYGTLISEGVHMAFMEDLASPITSPGRGKRQATLKKNDTLSGYTLKEIAADHVVMARGEELLTIRLVDEQKPKQRIAAVTQPAAVQGTRSDKQQVPPTGTVQPDQKQQESPPPPTPPKPDRKTQQQENRAPGQQLLDFFRRGR